MYSRKTRSNEGSPLTECRPCPRESNIKNYESDIQETVQRNVTSQFERIV